MAFDPKTPSETRLLTFDMGTKAPTGVTLSTPVLTKSLLSGTGSASDLTLGTGSVVNRTITALASAGTDGATYRIKCVANGSTGEVYEVDEDLFVSASAAIV